MKLLSILKVRSLRIKSTKCHLIKSKRFFVFLVNLMKAYVIKTLALQKVHKDIVANRIHMNQTFNPRTNVSFYIRINADQCTYVHTRRSSESLRSQETWIKWLDSYVFITGLVLQCVSSEFWLH